MICINGNLKKTTSKDVFTRPRRYRFGFQNNLEYEEPVWFYQIYVSPCLDGYNRQKTGLDLFLGCLVISASEVFLAKASKQNNWLAATAKQGLLVKVRLGKAEA